MNVVFVSHCDFTGNSAMHIFSIANHLQSLGVQAAVCTPNQPETVVEHGKPLFEVLSYERARAQPIVFPDGRGPDLVHAWTPRELVRKLTQDIQARYQAPYVVHLEDNEEAIIEDELQGLSFQRFAQLPAAILDQLVAEHRAHPLRYKDFLSGAAGMTALMDRLLEFKPAHVPGTVLWAGFDEAFATQEADPAFRASIGLAADDFAVVYTGNTHASNAREARSLFAAIGALHRRGLPIKLVRTGWNHADIPCFEDGKRAGYIIDLGFVPRASVPKLTAIADVLVQPGCANDFNDYRFPSKLPEFLAAGKPVLLPRSNLGRFLHDGVECVLLDQGNALDIASKLEALIADPDARQRIGAAGREFALRELNWPRNADKVKALYDRVLDARPAIEIGDAAEAAGSTVMPSAAAAVGAAGSQWPVKTIAFYLPQFYPIPENDAWWGKGFTEWTNVSRARSSFPGHVQPRLPADLGFYDLRVPEVLEYQAELARSHGIYGFCFYYYWFNGRKLLERPLEQMLARGKPDQPFCICWANENWSRRWDGSEHEILMQQDYSTDASERFIRDVIPILRDPRYIRVGGAPLLLVYRVNLLPDAPPTMDLWRSICAREGIGTLHIAAVQSFGILDPKPFGCDSAVEFPPHTKRALLDPASMPGISRDFRGYLEDYVAVSRDKITEPPPPYIRYRGVMPAWDNTPRRQERAHILVNTTPASYQAWLEQAVVQTMSRSAVQEPLLFINAWNEWAEGAYLEPDSHHGHAYLEATHRGLCEGVATYYRREGFAVGPEMASRIFGLPPPKPPPDPTAAGAAPVAAVPAPPAVVPAPPHAPKTASWCDDARLSTVADRYRKFPVEPLSYATVADFCDSVDHLRFIATANGDLKDCQRPWVFKAILSQVPRGARILEIGAGEPFVADLLQRLSYQVWIVDPYDGSGNGPREYERFRSECPALHFVRGQFTDEMPTFEPGAFDCIYSISVLEHIPDDGLRRVFAGTKKLLRPQGISIHAVDHVHRGNGAAEHLDKLRLITTGFGLSVGELDRLLVTMTGDTDTYYLSAESHNRWRGSVPYEQFPMRVCVSVQMVSPARLVPTTDARS